MAKTDLHATAEALVADGKGILAADESSGTIKKRFDSIGLESTEDEPARVPRHAVHDAGRRGVHQRRHPLRRDDPPERARRHAVPEAARVEGDHPRHQGRPRREAARRAPRARRSPRASTGCASASPSTTSSARASRSGARRTRSPTTLPSEYCIWTNAHALARYAALCQEAGHRADRRAGGPAGRHAHDRARRGRGVPRARRALHRAVRPARRSLRHAAEAEHGALRLRARRSAPASRMSPSRRCASSTSTCPPRCRGSCSSPAASRTRTRPRTSTR